MCNFFSFKTNGNDRIYYFSGEQRKSGLKFKNGDKVNQWDSHTSVETYYGLKDTDWSSGEYNPFTDKLVIDQQHTEWDDVKVRGMLAKVEWETLCGDLEGARKFIADLKNVKWFQNHGPIPEGVKMFETRGDAQDVALDAARNAARDAALDAARDAALDAAVIAAVIAARNAARDAAGEAARKAAGNAAGNAARNAAGNAARNAAGNAARNAARDAALDAAVDAALVISIMFVCTGLNLDKKHIDYAKKRWSAWEAGYGVYCDIGGVLYCYKRP